MTHQSEVKNDDRYDAYLDHGFVGLVEVMGSDSSIEESARMSYGKGTRSVSDTRNLLRYLIRNHHTSPLEMGELRFHLKIPIFVMRQLVRHRTAGLNEYSGRYSEMVDEFYLPEDSRIQVQSASNKQGSGETIPDEWLRTNIRARMTTCHETAYEEYRCLLTNGVSRELARIILPVSNYTELYWKCDIHNFLKMVSQRLDPHAQWEVREMARLMYEQAKPHFPFVFEAFEDYILNGGVFSAIDLRIIRDLLQRLDHETIMNSIMTEPGMTKRERDELIQKLGVQDA